MLILQGISEHLDLCKRLISSSSSCGAGHVNDSAWNIIEADVLDCIDIFAWTFDDVAAMSNMHGKASHALQYNIVAPYDSSPQNFLTAMRLKASICRIDARCLI